MLMHIVNRSFVKHSSSMHSDKAGPTLAVCVQWEVAVERSEAWEAQQRQREAGAQQGLGVAAAALQRQLAGIGQVPPTALRYNVYLCC